MLCAVTQGHYTIAIVSKGIGVTILAFLFYVTVQENHGSL